MCDSFLMFLVALCIFFFFKQKTAYEMRISDWSSDVCSSDLPRCQCLAHQRRCRRNHTAQVPAVRVKRIHGDGGADARDQPRAGPACMRGKQCEKTIRTQLLGLRISDTHTGQDRKSVV